MSIFTECWALVQQFVLDNTVTKQYKYCLTYLALFFLRFWHGILRRAAMVVM
jgi:hypothetical protein